MATYVNDLRLKEIGTGESSGTWGTETNVNLELIGEALGYATEGITTNADTHATTVADGSTDPGRAMYIKYTGTLDSACTITIGPNTMSRVHIIENAKSGSQNIIIKQGSGAEVTIPNGFVKAVYLDGAGSGAAVIEAFTDLSVGGKLLIDGATPTLTIGDAGAVDTKIVFDGNAQDFYIGLDDSADDLVFGKGSTLGTTQAMAIDENMDVAFGPTTNVTITNDGNEDTLTLVSTDADANAGPNLRLYRNSSSPADNDALGFVEWEGRNDNSQDVIYGQIAVYASDVSDGTEDSNLYINTIVGGTVRNRINAYASQVVINEESIDSDFRVESNGNANAIFVNGGDDRVTFFNGTTINTASGTDDGASHYSDGRTDISRASAQPLNLRRRTDDGVIINFYKEASGSVTNIGAVGTLTGDLVIHSNTADHVGLRFGNTRLQPCDNTGATSDGASDLGFSNSRFKDLYLSGKILAGITAAPTGVLLGNQLVSASATGSEIIAFRSDTSVAVNDICGALLIGNSDTDGTEDHFVGMYGKVSSTNGSQDLHFAAGRSSYEGDAPHMTIVSGGQLCAGQTTAINSAHTFTRSQADNIAVFNNTVTSGNPYGIQVRWSGAGSGVGGDYIATYTNTTGSLVKKFCVAGDGDVTNANNSYGAISDERLKENIVDATDKLNDLKQIKIRNFNFKGNDTKQIGVVAQELETIFPALITEREDRDADGNELGTTTKEVKYSVLLPIAIKAIQEQQALIETLQTKVKALEEA